MTETIDIEACRAWIDREETRTDLLTPELVKRFCATLNLPAGDPAPGEAAPLAIHWCLAPTTVSTAVLGRDGHPERGDVLPPIGLPRRMWAGGQLEFFARPLRVGDTVKRVSRIENVALKQGRTGPLCFVTVIHVYSADDAIAVRERQDIVYRGAGPSVAPPTGAPSPATEPQPRWSRAVDCKEVLLFRYSALTFNGHRIHYDRRFCVEQEGYPGLVVHGPLQATLLAGFAAELRGQAPRSFTFRSTAPLFDGNPFTLNADESAAGLDLWTAAPDGRRAMQAKAVW